MVLNAQESGRSAVYKACISEKGGGGVVRLPRKRPPIVKQNRFITSTDLWWATVSGDLLIPEHSSANTLTPAVTRQRPPHMGRHLAWSFHSMGCEVQGASSPIATGTLSSAQIWTPHTRPGTGDFQVQLSWKPSLVSGSREAVLVCKGNNYGPPNTQKHQNSQHALYKGNKVLYAAQWNT